MADSPRGAPVESRPRRRGPRLVFAAVVLVQVGLIGRSYLDPHNLFGFQPFNESSTIEADIVRVTAGGERVPISEPWPGGYDWNTLMHFGPLENPSIPNHAYSGTGTMLDFYEEALDWVADNTPKDRETVRLEATIRTSTNTEPVVVTVFVSKDRDLAD